MIKVCHVTSVHPTEDIRIFKKECLSLKRAGYDVTLVQQGGDYEKDGVRILGFGAIEDSRIKRMRYTSKNAYQRALEVDADIYHFHDPELLPYAVKLKKKGKNVIFDSHEDVPADILEKYWIPAPLRRLISLAYGWYEAQCFRKLDGVIGVTPTLCDRLKKSSRRSVMVTNYPILDETMTEPSFASRKIVFPGLISKIWCIDKLLGAMESIDDVTLELRSRDIEEPYGSRLRSLPGWKKVHFPGSVSHGEVLQLLSECMCGVALLQECPNSGGRMGTLGNTKIFEYMMAGIPVVCTDFVLWKQIIDKWDCGICVNPQDEKNIADALRYLLDNPGEARRMGENGRRAVATEYNWNREEEKLLAFYDEIIC